MQDRRKKGSNLASAPVFTKPFPFTHSLLRKGLGKKRGGNIPTEMG